jgi:hypothetical protein
MLHFWSKREDVDGPARQDAGDAGQFALSVVQEAICAGAAGGWAAAKIPPVMAAASKRSSRADDRLKPVGEDSFARWGLVWA